jgi:hypothetical protein
MIRLFRVMRRILDYLIDQDQPYLLLLPGRFVPDCHHGPANEKSRIHTDTQEPVRPDVWFCNIRMQRINSAKDVRLVNDVYDQLVQSGAALSKIA